MGVAVLGDEVLVCKDHNEGTIIVYDKRDFKYLRRIVDRYGAFLLFFGYDHKGVRC